MKEKDSPWKKHSRSQETVKVPGGRVIVVPASANETEASLPGDELQAQLNHSHITDASRATWRVLVSVHIGCHLAKIHNSIV